MRAHPSSEDIEESVALRLTMLLAKLMLCGLALVSGCVALMNYRVVLHADGNVEFVRKSEWTLTDSFRFVAEYASASPPPPVAQAPALPPAPAPALTPAPQPPTPSPTSTPNPPPPPSLIAIRPKP